MSVGISNESNENWCLVVRQLDGYGMMHYPLSRGNQLKLKNVS